jgi:uncharacterized protein with HEPN domain
MSRDNQRLDQHLNHILEAIVRIQRYVDTLDEAAFLADELIQDAVIRNLEVIGEASRNIGKYFPAFAEQHAEIPFSIAYEMRNALAHGYFKVDLEVVWKTIERDLPELKAIIAELKKRMDEA